MRLTIISDDKAVYLDGDSLDKLELTSLPSNVHALQWNGESGIIEYKDGKVNETINQLPYWAFDAIDIYKIAKNTPIEIPVISLNEELPIPTKEELFTKILELQAQLEFIK
jgi:hypothetical protein